MKIRESLWPINRKVQSKVPPSEEPCPARPCAGIGWGLPRRGVALMYKQKWVPKAPQLEAGP